MSVIETQPNGFSFNTKRLLLVGRLFTEVSRKRAGPKEPARFLVI